MQALDSANMQGCSFPTVRNDDSGNNSDEVAQLTHNPTNQHAVIQETFRLGGHDLSEHTDDDDDHSEDEYTDDDDEYSLEESGGDYTIAWPPNDSDLSDNDLVEDLAVRNHGSEPATARRKLNPDLCKYCRCTLTLGLLFVPLAAGCHLCALFISQMRAQHGFNEIVSDLRPKGRLELWNAKSLVAGDRNEWLLNLFFEKDIDSGVDMSPHKSFEPELSKERWCTEASKVHKRSRIVEPTIGCLEDSTALVRHWLEECRTTHKDCQSQQKKQRQLPTRLIKIDCQPVRLCMSSDYDCLAYATLSHCWGNFETLRLRNGNLKDFLEEIPFGKLCKTFRDAIDIARVLGFSWLWIDSLCIIQGDKVDWQYEAARMATVYGFSSLNIAATASPDGSFGCLFERDSIYTQRQQVVVTDSVGNEEQVFDITPKHLLHDNMATAPLLSRAWVMQERALAPRTLHFAASQLFWECQMQYSCETFPDTIPQMAFASAGYGQSGYGVKPLSSWSSITSKYSDAELTNEGDRLVAIAGIARKRQEQNGDGYFAGLWRKNLETQICFRINPDYTSSTRAQGSPSWSWVVMRGSWDFCPDECETRESFIDILDVNVTLAGEDKFGSVKGGVLTVSSRYMSRCKYYHTFATGSREYRCAIWSDNVLQLERNPWIVPIRMFSHKDRYGFEALLLKSTNQKNGQYKRTGAFVIDHTSLKGLMGIVSDITNGELRYEIHSCNEQGVLVLEHDFIITESDYVSVNVNDAGVNSYTINIV